MRPTKQRLKDRLGVSQFIKKIKAIQLFFYVKGSSEYSKSDNEDPTKWYVSFVVQLFVISNDFLRLDCKISLEFFNIAWKILKYKMNDLYYDLYLVLI